MANEQWLTEGKCRECRRQKYCTKKCKKRKEAEAILFEEILVSACTKAPIGKNRREEPGENDHNGSRTEKEAPDEH